MIIAVDFDGTIVSDAYPKIGMPRAKTINYIKCMKEEGCKIILWTCRSDKQLEEALEACRLAGIEFDAVNDNLPEVKELYGNNSRKIYADVYIDDRSFTPVEVFEERQRRREAFGVDW